VTRNRCRTISSRGWMSTTPDGIPLLLRDLEIEEIYTLDVGLP
jgi:hypothetical protein